MKYIITEIIIPRSSCVEIFSPQRIKIRVMNEGAGNYLAIEGINDEPELESPGSSHEMYFETKQQIDDFASICKNLLNQNRRLRAKTKEEKL